MTESSNRHTGKTSRNLHPEQARFALLQALAQTGFLSDDPLAHLQWKIKSDESILEEVLVRVKNALRGVKKILQAANQASKAAAAAVKAAEVARVAAKKSGSSSAKSTLKKAEAKAAKARVAVDLAVEKATAEVELSFAGIKHRVGEGSDDLKKNETESYEDYFQRVYTSYFKKLFNDAKSNAAKIDFKRAVALYGAVPDERQLLGAFLLLFAQPTSDRSPCFSRANAEEALRHPDVLFEDVDCNRLKKIMRDTSAFVREFHGLNQTPGMVGASKECGEAKKFVGTYLRREHVPQAGQKTLKPGKVGFREVIAMADRPALTSAAISGPHLLSNSKVGAIDPMALTRLGVVARCFPNAKIEVVQQVAQECNDVLLERLSKQCKASPNVALSVLGMFHMEMAASALKKGSDACAALKATVKKLLETAIGPYPPLAADATSAERLTQTAMEAGFVPLLRDCQSKEASLRRRLSDLIENNKESEFKALIRELLDANRDFDTKGHQRVGELLLQGQGAASTSQESYQDFLWRFLVRESELSVDSPPRSSFPPRSSLWANAYALLPFFLPLLVALQSEFVGSFELHRILLFVFENVEQLTALNVPILLKSARTFFKTLTSAEEQEILDLEADKDAQWRLLSCIFRPFQCRVDFRGWSPARICLSAFILWVVYCTAHPLAALGTVDYAFNFALGFKPVQFAASTIAKGSASALKRTATSLHGAMEQAKKRRVELADPPSREQPILAENRKRSADVDHVPSKRQRVELVAQEPPIARGVVGLVAGADAVHENIGRGDDANLPRESHDQHPSPQPHPVVQTANSLFAKLKSFGSYLSRRSSPR